MTTKEDTKAALADAAAGTDIQAADGQTFATWIRTNREEINKQFPVTMNEGMRDRFLRTVLTMGRIVDHLAECTRESVLGCIFTAATLGLEPGATQLAHFIPFKNKIPGTRQYRYEAQFVIGYRGIIELARRSQVLASCEAHEVYDVDEFDAMYGSGGFVHHRPNWRDRRPWVREDPNTHPWGYWAMAKYTNGGENFVVMNNYEIAWYKAKSRASGSDYSPWNTDYPSMARKTCVRRLEPYLPKSPELLLAFAHDEKVVKARHGEIIDVSAVEADAPALPEATAGQTVEDLLKNAGGEQREPVEANLATKPGEPLERDGWEQGGHD